MALNYGVDTNVVHTISNISDGVELVSLKSDIANWFKHDTELFFEVKKGLGCTKVRKYYTLPGLSNGVRFIVHNNSLVNLVRGLIERVFLVRNSFGVLTRPPQPVSKLFVERMRGFKSELLKTLPSTTVWSRQEFVDSYDGRRRVVYAAAAESLLGKGILKQDAESRSFVKAEKVCTVKLDPVPRIIQPRSPRYNVEVGRYLRPLEHTIYAAIAQVFGSTTVFKGLNAEQQGRKLKEKWDRFYSPVAIGIDASRFDQHISDVALEWEHSIYNSHFHDPYLRMLLRWQVNNVGRCFTPEGSIKYRVKGCRFSGDMNTALGNCLIMCALVYSYLHHVGVDTFEFVNNGDDGVIIIERADLNRVLGAFEAWFLEMGFTMKIETPVTVFEQIEFCQTRPVLGPHGYVLVRNPRVALSKDFVYLNDLDTPRKQRAYLNVIGEGGLSLTSGIPVFQNMYRRLIVSDVDVSIRKHYLEHVRDTGFHRLGVGMIGGFMPVSPATRYSFWLAFGVTPDEQVILEEFYDGASVGFTAPIQVVDVDVNPWMPV